MRRQTQIVLYHLLPVVFWLLAIGGSLVPAILQQSFISNLYYWGYLVAVLVLWVIWIISRIKRHTSSVEECFLVAVLLGVASYWLPTVVFVILPVWGYLIYQNIFGLRACISSFMGFAVVLIWAAVFVWMEWITNPWATFFSPEQAVGWIPLGAILMAWLASTIARHILRVR